MGRSTCIALICAVFICSGCVTPTATPTSRLTPLERESSHPTATHTLIHTTSPTNTATSAPPPTATPTPAPSSTPWLLVEDPVTILAADGVQLVGTFYAPQHPPPPWPGVLLLHMVYGSRQDWQDFVTRLTGAGYAVLALDMRAHGDSGGSLEWDKFGNDLLRVWDYFASRPDVEAGHSGVVGASIGANMALRLGASQPGVGGVVLLSPGLDYYGVTTADALETYGQRPLLIAASEEDSYAAESSRQLLKLAGGDAVLEMYSGAGHGTVMFSREPGLADLIVGWLDQKLMP
ncbi:MAG: alpha/beta hydrolase [Anaerolineales bacterium]